VICDAEHVQYVVLDEADKMLFLGLQPQLKRIRALVIPRKSNSLDTGAGALVKPHTRRKRPQVRRSGNGSQRLRAEDSIPKL